MDVLNKLRHEMAGSHGSSHTDDQPHVTPAAPVPATTDPEPERDLVSKLIAGSGHVTHNRPAEPPTTTISPPATAHSSLLDKLTHKQEREEKAAALAAREIALQAELDAVVREQRDNEGVLGRLLGEHQQQTPDAGAHHHGFSNMLDRVTHREDRERRAAELAAREADVRAKLEEVRKEKVENEGVLERVRAKIEAVQQGRVAAEEAGGKVEGEETGGLHGLLDKVTGREEERRRREEEERKRRENPLERMKDRVSEQFGGGRKAEEREDWVDKTVDLVQEHVLHEGPQDDESTFERMKDEQIAAAVRKQLHLEKKRELD